MKSINEILKKGILFGLAIGFFSVLLDYTGDDSSDFFSLIKKNALSSLMFGLGFGVFIAFFKRDKKIK